MSLTRKKKLSEHILNKLYYKQVCVAELSSVYSFVKLVPLLFYDFRQYSHLAVDWQMAKLQPWAIQNTTFWQTESTACLPAGQSISCISLGIRVMFVFHFLKSLTILKIYLADTSFWAFLCVLNFC